MSSRSTAATLEGARTAASTMSPPVAFAREEAGCAGGVACTLFPALVGGAAARCAGAGAAAAARPVTRQGAGAAGPLTLVPAGGGRLRSAPTYGAAQLPAPARPPPGRRLPRPAAERLPFPVSYATPCDGQPAVEPGGGAAAGEGRTGRRRPPPPRPAAHCAPGTGSTRPGRGRRRAAPGGHPGPRRRAGTVTAGTDVCTPEVQGAGAGRACGPSRAAEPPRAGPGGRYAEPMPDRTPARYVYLGPEGTFAEQALLTIPAAAERGAVPRRAACRRRSTRSAPAPPTPRWCRWRTPSAGRSG